MIFSLFCLRLFVGLLLREALLFVSANFAIQNPVVFRGKSGGIVSKVWAGFFGMRAKSGWDTEIK